MYPRVIGLAGRMGSGKNAVADILAARGYEQIAFGDALRREVTLAVTMGRAPTGMPTDMAADLLACDEDEVYGKPTTERMRRILQYHGTEIRRAQNPDYWVWRLQESLDPGKRYAITDVRFLNEAELCRRLGGQVWWIERPRTQLAGIKNHVSEKLTADIADQVIDNSRGLAELRITVIRAFEIAVCISEQARCASELPDQGAALGLEDWTKEEAILRTA